MQKDASIFLQSRENFQRLIPSCKNKLTAIKGKTEYSASRSLRPSTLDRQATYKLSDSTDFLINRNGNYKNNLKNGFNKDIILLLFCEAG